MADRTRLSGPRGGEISVLVNGTPVQCCEGETVATALLAAGVREFHHAVDGSPRAPFCNMGTCFACAVTIDERPLQRACLIPVRAGMTIRTEED